MSPTTPGVLHPLTALLALPVLHPHLVVAGALVGLLVGVTGMGGGALLTPILVLVFHVPPLAAVSSDLLTSLVIKPFGGAIHLARGSVNRPLLGWLVLGSVPAAFAGSVAIGLLGHGAHAALVQSTIKVAVAIALLASVGATLVRLWHERRGGERRPFAVRPAVTVAIGVVGGLAVGLSSVGAGTLVIAMLLLAYPALTLRELIGTDIVQAIPLVAAATLGHLLFGDVRPGLTASLLVGAIPAVVLGARFSSAAPPALARPVVAAVLAGSALALLRAPGPTLWVGAAASAAVAWLLGRPTADQVGPSLVPAEAPATTTHARRQ